MGESPWETLHAAIRLARMREQIQRERTDMFIYFISVGMESKLQVRLAIEYCKTLGIKAYNYAVDAVEIHSLPSELIPGVETDYATS